MCGPLEKKPQPKTKVQEKYLIVQSHIGFVFLKKSFFVVAKYNHTLTHLLDHPKFCLWRRAHPFCQPNSIHGFDIAIGYVTSQLSVFIGRIRRMDPKDKEWKKCCVRYVGLVVLILCENMPDHSGACLIHPRSERHHTELLESWHVPHLTAPWMHHLQEKHEPTRGLHACCLLGDVARERLLLLLPFVLTRPLYPKPFKEELRLATEIYTWNSRGQRLKRTFFPDPGPEAMKTLTEADTVTLRLRRVDLSVKLVITTLRTLI